MPYGSVMGFLIKQETMKKILTLLLLILGASVVSAQQPLLIKAFENLTIPSNPAVDSVDALRLKRSTESKIRQEEHDQEVKQYTKNLSEDFEKLENILSSETLTNRLRSDPPFRDSTFKILMKAPDVEHPLTLRFSEILNIGCQNIEIPWSIPERSKIQEFINNHQLVIEPLRFLISCNQIERLPPTVISEEFADTLMGLITKLLNTYTKFETRPSDYEQLESRKHFSNLREKIYFRVEFIKYCYARI